MQEFWLGVDGPLENTCPFEVASEIQKDYNWDVVICWSINGGNWIGGGLSLLATPPETWFTQLSVIILCIVVIVLSWYMCLYRMLLIYGRRRFYYKVISLHQLILMKIKEALLYFIVNSHLNEDQKCKHYIHTYIHTSVFDKLVWCTIGL